VYAKKAYPHKRFIRLNHNQMKRSNLIFWIITIIITLSIVIYQRYTGPTKAVRGKLNIDNNSIKFKLQRSAISGINAEVKIPVSDSTITGSIKYKRFKSYDEWTSAPMVYTDGHLTASLPTLAPAGKIMYGVTLTKDEAHYTLTKQPVILRYKGDVPGTYLLPHIIFMFAGLLLSIRSAFEALFLKKKLMLYALLTFISLFLGGLLFGPIVQKYAFGAYWTGFPFGHDLTDNKTAIACIFWAFALFTTIRKWKSAPLWVFIAAAVLLATYLIPHSVLGSELDYTAIE